MVESAIGLDDEDDHDDEDEWTLATTPQNQGPDPGTA